MIWKRVYPPSLVATAVVWLLDRLPDNVRQQALKSYWWDEELRAIKARVDEDGRRG